MDEPPSSWRAKRRLIGALSSNQSGANSRASYDLLLSGPSQETRHSSGRALEAVGLRARATWRRVARASPQHSLSPRLGPANVAARDRGHGFPPARPLRSLAAPRLREQGLIAFRVHPAPTCARTYPRPASVRLPRLAALTFQRGLGIANMRACPVRALPESARPADPELAPTNERKRREWEP